MASLPEFAQITPLRRSLVNRWLPILLCFLLMLTTSAASLVHVTPVSVIVWRNINLLTVALGIETMIKYYTVDNKAAGEFVLYGTSQGVTSVIALVVVAIGSIAFAYEDLVSQDVDSSGIGIAYFALVINTLATTGYNLYNKSSFRPRLDPISSVFYNNALSILPMVALTATFEGRAPMAFMRSPAWDALLHLVLSGLIGFAISWTGFELQSRVSATGFTVATNVNKVGCESRSISPVPYRDNLKRRTSCPFAGIVPRYIFRFSQRSTTFSVVMARTGVVPCRGVCIFSAWRKKIKKEDNIV